MHVGGLGIYELGPDYQGSFIDDVRQHIQSRMHLATIFQRKLVNMPFDLANPVWVMDDSLDIEHHLRHVIVPPPAGRAQVDRLVARLHSSLLDRSRPLWEMVVLEGLPTPADALPGTRYVGLYSKFHHASLDGMGGQVLMQAIMDVGPTPRTVAPARARHTSDLENFGIAELAVSGARHNATQTWKLAKTLPMLVRKAVQILRPSQDKSGSAGGGKRDRMAWFAPKTPFNVTITNQRSFARFSIPLAEVKEIGAINQVSLNDVVMAISGEGLRRFLADMGCHPTESLLAAVPVSLREEGNTEFRNQVSMARMSLASTERDPLKRLQAIHQSSQNVKAIVSDVRPFLPTDFPSIGAPWLVSGLASLFFRSRLVNSLPPLANVLISNVPGPNMPLYFAGAKQISTYPVSIPMHGLALNITLQSYNGWIDFGLIGCRRAVPDIADLGKHMQAAHAEFLKLSRAQANPAPALEDPAKPRNMSEATKATKATKAKLKTKATA